MTNLADRDQQLVAAGMHYLTLLDGDQPPNIRDFVATADPMLRDELPGYLELMLATGSGEDVMLTPTEGSMVERATTRLRARMQAHTSAPSFHTLSEARTARRLSLGALARQLNLPPDLLARIERGGVVATTMPARLIAHLAAALGQAEDDIRALLAAPVVVASTRLSAADGTVTRREVAVSFADALRASAASAAQQDEWS